ncbi:MAG: glutaredoxin family protein [Acidobacteriota bacterium]
MKQQCYLVAIWLSWLGLSVLFVVVGVLHGWTAAGFVLLVTVLAQLAYIRWFPHLSKWIGYGSVADVSAGVVDAPPALPRVTLYTANLCPFCPLVKQRLTKLQQQLNFELEQVDVTLRPGLILAKGLRSVPVVEAGGRLLAGNATSEELAAFLTGTQG